MVIKKEQPDGIHLVLYPNRSASWQQVKWLMMLFGFVCFGIALAWTYVGAWLVLPFAGLEVGLLVFVMYYVTQMTHRKELVVVQEERIRVQSGIKTPTLSWDLDKGSTKVLLMEVRHPEDPVCVHLIDDKQRLELGRYLNLEDKELMIDELKALGLQVKNVKRPVQVKIQLSFLLKRSISAQKN